MPGASTVLTWIDPCAPFGYSRSAEAASSTWILWANVETRAVTRFGSPVSQSNSAVRQNGVYVINGTKRFTTTGINSGLVIVTAKTDEAKRHKGISAFVVEKGTPGFIVDHEDDKLGLRAENVVAKALSLINIA